MPNVRRIIDGVGEDQPSQVVVRLEQCGSDARKVQTDVGGPNLHDVGDGVLWKYPWQQYHELGQRIGLSHAVQFIDEERGIDERIAKAGAFYNCASVVSDPLRLELKNHPNASCGNFEGLLQRGNALPIACVQPLDLLKRHRSDKPSLIGGAVDGIVVQQHEMTVVGFPQVDFNEVRVKRTGFPDTRKRIFRGVAGSSPMTDTKGGSDSDLA